ncbi:uridine diphosphate glucose pyrophosphatase NUDT14-like [Dreissena polymorpha]|uniref:Uridine diphosphate glucose pyrophosphatase NUDT14 n=1 Tax=Dreissena polymorpha TaxID=45954 RepID=A0A9D4L3F0_DREPO|nr:uridine diphosphate glucose pyrophosphatase NUDT14-like [Dreissena polymorpha]XP_052275164.1 uridine diphosphate glucose pyrophosphatase NUDT14-like [Dreissena polymorpha]KAH3851212.1 hypothetical protein DPMN_093691 [Dreissena polymorpha]
MDDINDVKIVACENSKYIKPLRLQYTQNGKKKIWDAMKVHDSVVVVVYNSSRDVLVLVRQFRPAIYINSVEISRLEDGSQYVDIGKYPGHLGLTYEFCAGIIDKDKPILDIAREELLEECGYAVPPECIRRITGFRTGVGTAGARQEMFYAEVTDEMKVAAGGGIADEGEMIDVVEIPAADALKFAYDETINKPVGVLYGLTWFMTSVYQKPV